MSAPDLTPTLREELDPQTAAEVVAALVVEHLDNTEVTVHGDVYTVTRCQVLRRSDGYPWAVSMTISDDTRGESINATLHVAADPIPRWDR